MVSLLDSLHGIKISTPKGYIHKGAFSRDGTVVKEAEKKLKNPLCPKCNKSRRAKIGFNKWLTYCLTCTRKAARRAYRERKKEGKELACVGKVGRPRSVICPRCKVNPKVRDYCAECTKDYRKEKYKETGK